MKILFVAPVMILSAAAFADDPISLTGKWQVENSIAGNESTQNCTFTQKDAGLTGSCESANGKVEITGKIEGKRVTWSYKSQYEGNPLTVAYDGTVESATKITGAVSVPEYSVTGEFTATQSK